MALEITECIYCGRHCKLTEPNCERGRELVKQIQEGIFDPEVAMKEQEARKRDGGDQGRGSYHHGEHHHGDLSHRGHHHHKDHDHYHDKAER